MRLIDADELKEFYKANLLLPDKDNEIIVKTMVDAVPTAYDVDKVIEELEDYLFERYCVEGDEKIEEIVKGGCSE